MAAALRSTASSRPNDSMASVPTNSESASGPAFTADQSSREPKLRRFYSLKAPHSVQTGREDAPQSSSSEKQLAQDIHWQRPSRQVLKTSPPWGQFVINTLLQIAGFGAATAFGIFAVRSVGVGDTGNQFAHLSLLQAIAANRLTILTFCFANGSQVGRSPKTPIPFQRESFTKTLPLFTSLAILRPSAPPSSVTR